MFCSLSIFAAEKQKKTVKLSIKKIDSCTVFTSRINADGTTCGSSATAPTCAEAEKIAISRICC